MDTEVDPFQPIDDDLLRSLLYSVTEYEEETYTERELKKRLEQEATWDNTARQRLNSLIEELQRRKNKNEGDKNTLQKYKDDPRVNEYINEGLSKKFYKDRIKIVNLLVTLGTEWAVEKLRDVSRNDTFYSEESTAPDYLTDPDVIDRYPIRKVWDVRNEAVKGLKKLGIIE